MLDRLVTSLETCPMIKRGEYNYFIHPITDGVPIIEPALLREVCTAMVKMLDLTGEIAVHQTTGYSKVELYLNGIKKGDRVVIIDDVVSTGGTMKALLQALALSGADVVDVCIAVQRGDPDIGRPYKSLVKIEVTDRVYVVERHI